MYFGRNENSKTMLSDFITGVTGQLGYDIKNELLKRNISAIGTGSNELDITNETMVMNYFDTHKISHVFHCAAYTKVDLAEKEKNKNFDINVNGTKYIVSACKKYDIPLMFFSTDYVFGGEGNEPFKVDDIKNPLCEYAKAKYEAEKIVQELNKYFIVRISWVFGLNGNNFVKTILKLSQTKDELNVISDQIGSPSYTVDISKAAVDLMYSNKFGVYHITNEGYVSWADFAREILKIKGIKTKINDITTEEYNAPAKRPKNSRLDKSKFYNEGFEKMPHWIDALNRYLCSEGA